MIVKYKFEVERRRHGRKVMEEAAEPEAKRLTPKTAASPVSRKARQLALAY